MAELTSQISPDALRPKIGLEDKMFLLLRIAFRNARNLIPIEISGQKQFIAENIMSYAFIEGVKKGEVTLIESNDSGKPKVETNTESGAPGGITITLTKNFTRLMENDFFRVLPYAKGQESFAKEVVNETVKGHRNLPQKSSQLKTTPMLNTLLIEFYQLWRLI